MSEKAGDKNEETEQEQEQERGGEHMTKCYSKRGIWKNLVIDLQANSVIIV